MSFHKEGPTSKTPLIRKSPTNSPLNEESPIKSTLNDEGRTNAAILERLKSVGGMSWVSSCRQSMFSDALFSIIATIMIVTVEISPEELNSVSFTGVLQDDYEGVYVYLIL